MKQQKLFSASVPPACSYCAIGKATEDQAHILCVKKGVMQPDSACRHFQYDPLRRVPRRKAELPQYDASDFSID